MSLRAAAGAAHEINNPLTTIAGHAQLVLKAVTGKKTKRSVKTIISQTARISGIIAALMGLARPTKLKAEATDIGEVIQGVLSVVHGRLKASGVSVTLDQPPDLPIIFDADPQQLEQVFLNLIINATQAMQSGGRLRLSAYGDSTREYVVVAVRDTGSGIRDEHLSAVFCLSSPRNRPVRAPVLDW
jgi:signal transduction histidine kinase